MIILNLMLLYLFAFTMFEVVMPFRSSLSSSRRI